MGLIEVLSRRIALQGFVLIALTTVAFIIAHSVPGDPLYARLPSQAEVAGSLGIPGEAYEALRKKWGLDKPLSEQYAAYLWHLLHGDLGVSIRTGRDVSEELLLYFPATLELSLFALVISLVIGVGLGVLSAVKKDKWEDHISRIIALTGSSTPVFWVGLMILLIFYHRLGLFGIGRIDVLAAPPNHITGLYILDSLLTGNILALKSSINHIMLPAFVLGLRMCGIITRVTRSSMLDVLSQDYIRTALAMGIRKRRVTYRHALRNALIPTTTLAGLAFGEVLAGTVLTETIFAWPGIGLYAYEAMITVDYPAILGVTLLIAFNYSLINLLVDLFYLVLDPRMRYE